MLGDIMLGPPVASTKRLLCPYRDQPSPGSEFSPLIHLPESPRSRRPHLWRLPTLATLLDLCSLHPSYLLEGDGLLQTLSPLLTRLLQLCPAAFQFLALLHDMRGLGVP